ncbi:MAG: hypothetical protein LBG66_00275, partial [Gallionellaceae bacterium]|nr:hypothetical protein [Gallionellaceae bacterium]
MVTRKLFAHLGMDCLSAGIFQRGALTQMQDYAADEEGARRFAEFAAAQRATVYLVADLPEEDFRAESIPLLRRGERKALAQRKLEQLYPDTPFRYAARLPRASASERRETLLLCALSNPQPLTRWLDALAARHTPLVAIYSAAAVCA